MATRTIDKNLVIIWLKSNINDSYSNTLTRLQQIADQTYVFTDIDTCVDFITDNMDEKIFLILSTKSSPQLLPLIHSIKQLYHIYIHSNNAVEELGPHDFSKVMKVSNSMELICDLLQKDIRMCIDDMNSISIVSRDQCSTKNLRELPPSFMYTQILAEILFDIADTQNDMENLIHFWYQEYVNNESQLKNIHDFQSGYRSDLAISWYSRENFVYSILNQALRTLDANVLIKMGFFLHDLHRQIKQLHDQQSIDRIQQTVYRGQGMHTDEFDKLRNSPGGLLSFNNFLSTS